jgi:hypothetical protein
MHATIKPQQKSLPDLSSLQNFKTKAAVVAPTIITEAKSLKRFSISFAEGGCMEQKGSSLVFPRTLTHSDCQFFPSKYCIISSFSKVKNKSKK